MIVTLIDYKAGNLTSVIRALEHIGAKVRVTDDPAVVAISETVVVPGVGHFARTCALDPLRPAILERMGSGVPFLGICVGMQWLYEGSAEASEIPGLGIFAGTVGRFPSSVKSPHVGWNTLSRTATKSRLLPPSEDPIFVYYTHSYRCPLIPETTAITENGGAFSGIVERERIFGVQFHIEKSGDTGLALLRNFLRVASRC